MVTAEGGRHAYIDIAKPIQFRGEPIDVYQFTPEARRVVLLRARGFSVTQIGEQTTKARQTIKNYFTNLRQRLETTTMGVIIYALETGQIDAREIVKEFDFDKVYRLSPEQMSLFKEAVDPDKWDNSLKEFAYERSTSVRAIRSRLAVIYKRLAVRNMVHVRLYSYLMSEAQKKRLSEVQVFPSPLTPGEIEVMELKAKGLRNRQIAETLNIPENDVRVTLSRVIRRRKSESSFHVVSKLLETGELSSEKVSKGFQFYRYLLLTEREKKIVDSLGDPDTWQKGKKQGAFKLNISEGHFKNLISSILLKLQVPNGLGVAVFRLLLPDEVSAKRSHTA